MQPFLLYVLARGLARAGVIDAEFGRAIGRHRSTARLWLDGELKYSRDDTGIDAIATAAADALGVSPLALWEEALAEWRRDPEGVHLRARHDNLRAEWRLARQRGEPLPDGL